MAETLTLNTDPDSATDTENLTPDEQESLEIGEKMVAEQEQLLAGKYKNAEELEKAYVELQKNLEGKVMKLAKQLGTPNLLTQKKILKKRKKLRKILQQLP
jgi:hypothetical protein